MIKTVCISFCLVFVIRATNFCLKENELTDDEFYDAVQIKHFAKRRYKVLASECPDPRDNSTCLYVIDRIGYFKDGSWFVARFLTPVPSLTKGFLSVSRLEKPVFKSKSVIDTKNWQVDVGTMDPLTPNSVEFTTLFSTGHFPLNREISGNATFIGVATGGLMSFVGLYFKNLSLTGIDIDPQSEYLAKKWFGYRDRKNSKILIEDGAEYIKKMAERGETSDAVLVDACHNNEPLDGIYCPVEAVRSSEFLDNLSTVIGIRGMTVFNVYNHHNTAGVYERMTDEFKKHFVDCKLIDSRELFGNVFLVCSNKKLYDGRVNIGETQQFLRKMRIEQFMRDVV